MAEQEHRQTHAQREEQVQSESVIGIAAHRNIVLLSHKVAHADSHRCRHTRKHEIEQLRNGNHATQRKGSRFHTQLQCHRPSQPVHLLEIHLVDFTMNDIVSVISKFPAHHHHAHHRRRHEDAAYQGRDARSEQTQLRESRNTVNQNPVAQDVDHVSANHRPHRHLGLSDTIQELLHREEDAHEEHRCQVHQKVGADECEQFLRLSDAPQVEIEQDENQGEENARNHVGKEGVAHLLSDAVCAFFSVKSADDRGESVGESHVGYEYKTEDIVHQSGCRQFGRTVMTDHQRVGESQDDGTQLSDDDRNTDGKQFPVVMFIVACY